MKKEHIELLKNYKKALEKRNELRFSCKCPVYISRQENVDSLYKEICGLEDAGEISVQEVKNFLHGKLETSDLEDADETSVQEVKNFLHGKLETSDLEDADETSDLKISKTLSGISIAY